MDIRVFLSANNRTETDVSDEPLFWPKLCPIGRLLYISI